MAEPLVELTPPRARAQPGVADRARLERRARLLAHGGNAWHVIEFAVALTAGIAAGSIALIAFGADSLVEVLAGSVIVWLFTSDRGSSAQAERRAQLLIASSFFVLAAYVTAESSRDLAAGHRPSASWVGVGLAAFTAPTMPLLARAKRRLGHALGSAATVSEASQNQLCAYLAVALLVGLLLNAIWGLWWADPTAALVIAAVAVKEGRDSWQGASCDCC
jgi:divalent metal cation (Fe/Co/Zn/Cd) transporter